MSINPLFLKLNNHNEIRIKFSSKIVQRYWLNGTPKFDVILLTFKFIESLLIHYTIPLQQIFKMYFILCVRLQSHFDISLYV